MAPRNNRPPAPVCDHGLPCIENNDNECEGRRAERDEGGKCETLTFTVKLHEREQTNATRTAAVAAPAPPGCASC